MLFAFQTWCFILTQFKIVKTDEQAADTYWFLLLVFLSLLFIFTFNLLLMKNSKNRQESCFKTLQEMDKKNVLAIKFFVMKFFIPKLVIDYILILVQIQG